MGLLKLKHENELDLETESDREDEVEREHALLEGMLAAVRRAIRGIDGGYEASAVALERIWGPKGRHVTEALLRSCLAEDVETRRNYFRFEWLFWFALHSEEVRELLDEVNGKAKPKKSYEQLYRDQCAVIREELGGKLAERIIRKTELR